MAGWRAHICTNLAEPGARHVSMSKTSSALIGVCIRHVFAAFQKKSVHSCVWNKATKPRKRHQVATLVMTSQGVRHAESTYVLGSETSIAAAQPDCFVLLRRLGS